MRYVPIRARRPPAAARSLLGRAVLPGEAAFASWISPNMPLLPGPITVFRDRQHKAYDPADPAARADAIVVDGALILRRSAVEPVLAEAIARGEVALHPVVLAEPVAGAKPALGKPALETDWALLDVRARFPIPREGLSRSSFHPTGGDGAEGAFDPDRPHASLVASRPDAVTFEDPAPPFGVFRLHELPIDVFVREDLFERLNEATGGALEQGRMRPTLGVIDSTANGPPFGQTEEEAARSAAAFRDLLAGRAKKDAKELRRAALASPIYGYLTARLVDRAPADDTRAAALKHPFYAAAYARDVDRGPRDDTRDAAAGSESSTFEYMRYVDRGPHERTQAAMRESYRSQDFEVEAARVAAAAKAAREAAGAKDGSTKDGSAKDGSAAAGGSEAGARKPAGKAKKGGAKDGSAPQGGKAAARSFAPLVLTGPKRGEVYVTAPEAPSQELVPEVREERSRVVATDIKPSGPKALRKRIQDLPALGRSDMWPFLLRRSIAEEVFGGLPAGEVELREVDVRDAKGPIEADFVWVRVLQEYPLDRDASKAVYTDASKPHASLVKAVDHFAFSPGNEPPASIFRVGEMPNVVMAEEGLIASLKRAAGTGLGVKPPHGHLGMLPAFPLWSEGPPFAQSEEEAAASWAAYREMLAGARSEALRARALANPITAYWTARHVDGEPAEDTRRGALAHPHYAALYARYVDRAGRDDTRAAAAAEAVSALFYARYVDEALTPEEEAKLLASGWGPDDVKAIHEDLRRVREGR